MVTKKKAPSTKHQAPEKLQAPKRRKSRDISELFVVHLIGDLRALRIRAEQLNSWFKNISFLQTRSSLLSAIDHLDEAIKRANFGFDNLRKSAKSADKKSGGSR
jgi:hypothetical protein